MKGFPYDYVYFKAGAQTTYIQKFLENFHTITSILKLGPHRHRALQRRWSQFPYDYVYFKAQHHPEEVSPYPQEFPYDYVYFKALHHRDRRPRRGFYFHTITSILKRVPFRVLRGAEEPISIRLRLF